MLLIAHPTTAILAVIGAGTGTRPPGTRPGGTDMLNCRSSRPDIRPTKHGRPVVRRGGLMEIGMLIQTGWGVNHRILNILCQMESRFNHRILNILCQMKHHSCGHTFNTIRYPKGPNVRGTNAAKSCIITIAIITFIISRHLSPLWLRCCVLLCCDCHCVSVHQPIITFIISRRLSSLWLRCCVLLCCDCPCVSVHQTVGSMTWSQCGSKPERSNIVIGVDGTVESFLSSIRTSARFVLGTVAAADISSGGVARC